MSHHIRLFAAIALALGAAGSADAQTAAPAQKKIYCWDEGGRRVCGDALPASAVDRARTEISAKSGMTTGKVDRALTDAERGLGTNRVMLDEDAAEHLAGICDGDARRCLNALELATLTTEPDSAGTVHLTRAVLEESIQRKAVVYDATDDAHYDTISAFIKSIRGSDPDAAIYWLAKMLHAGEEIRFITRRLVICASEDIGLADSNALVVAQAAAQAVEFIGLPESNLILAHATLYLATAPKSNSATVAIGKASSEVREGRTLAVPEHLRDGHYKGSERLGHGKGYLYSHDFEGSYVPQAYLPEGRRYFEPTENGLEKRIKERLAHWREIFEEAQKNQR